MQAYQRATDGFDDVVAVRLGLNRTDLRCLDWLVDRPRSVGEPSAATGLSSSATTTLVDRLEAKGFVQRVRDPADRRKVQVEMTAEVREATDALYGPLVQEGIGLLSRIGDAELEVFHRFLVAAARADRAPHGPAPRRRRLTGGGPGACRPARRDLVLDETDSITAW